MGQKKISSFIKLKLLNQMNRIIKFRGLAFSSGEMVYGCLIKKRYNALADWMIEDENGLGSDVVTESIGQFTGLFDVDGGMIWEGDICIKERTGLKCLIVFNQGAWAIKYESNRGVFIQEFCNGANSKYLKVIGNIHQNKELLNAPN